MVGRKSKEEEGRERKNLFLESNGKVVDGENT